mmetsp:Transcript_106893/g.300964  ORF Transcript_106893/g.300964 Transcript_106893/m.300964 type:complete len:390 (-) Transcript_106893:30-1199(-)
MANVDVEGGFERLAQLWGLKQWKVEQEGEVVVSQTSQCEKSCVARIDFTHADLPYECKALVSRPEFMCEHTELFVTLNMEMIRMLSPGDAIVSMKYDAQLDRAVKMLVGQYSQELRFTLRRDFPNEGMTVALLAPPNPGGYMMFPHFTFLSYYIVVRPLDETSQATKVTHFLELPWPSFPSWATAFLHQIAMSEIVWARRFNCTETFELAKNYYVVLCLQSCPRGTPLLPCHLTSDGAVHADGFIQDVNSVNVGHYAWVPAQQQGFNFPEYLEQLLQVLGFSAQVYDCLDGRRLVPYHATMLGRDWSRVEESFAKLFREQRSAYRLMHGGKGAPKVTQVTKPRFLNIWTRQREPVEDDVVEERNTFLNVQEPLKVSISGLQMRRAAEYP